MSNHIKFALLSEASSGNIANAYNTHIENKYPNQNKNPLKGKAVLNFKKKLLGTDKILVNKDSKSENITTIYSEKNERIWYI